MGADAVPVTAVRRPGAVWGRSGHGRPSASAQPSGLALPWLPPAWLPALLQPLSGCPSLFLAWLRRGPSPPWPGDCVGEK